MKVILLLISILILVACGNKNQQIESYTASEIASLQLDSTEFMQPDACHVVEIDLNPYLGRNKEFDFGHAVKSLRVIPLETTDQSLISNIYKIIVTDKYVYLCDNFKGGGLIIFTVEGEFVKRIPHGGGPGEIYQLGDVAFDKNNNRLVIYQQPSFLYYYTAEGDFLGQKKLPFGFYNFAILPDGYLFKTLDGQGNAHLGRQKENTLLVTDSVFRLKYAGLPSEHYQANYGGYNYVYDNGTDVLITCNNNDTVYRYNNLYHKLESVYVMDYHDYKIPLDYWKNYSGRDFSEKRLQNNYYYFIGEYLETTTHQAFFLRNDYLRLQNIVYRDKRTGSLMGGSEAHYDYREMPPIAFPKTVYKDCFVSLHYPNKGDSLLTESTFLSDSDKQILKNLKAGDNPVLIMFQMKE